MFYVPNVLLLLFFMNNQIIVFIAVTSVTATAVKLFTYRQTAWNDYRCPTKTREFTLHHNVQRHVGRSKDGSFWVSLVTRTCNVWRNELSRHFVGHRTSFQVLSIRLLDTNVIKILWSNKPFAPPGKDTTNRRRKGDAWKVSYFRVPGRKVAMRKHEKVTIWRVFAWRLFAPKTR